MTPRALAISAPMPLCVAVSRRVGFSSRYFSPCRSFRLFYVCRAFAVRHGYSSPVIFIYFSISFSDLFHFSSPPPSGGCFRASSPVYGFFYSLALLAHVQYDALYKFL
jgi:hypothetical protein